MFINKLITDLSHTLGGAGGKGTWGSLTDEIYADFVTQDTHDPNYNSDEDEEVCIRSELTTHTM